MILIGASGHAKVIVDILKSSGEEVDFLIDANPDIKTLLDYKVYSEEEQPSFQDKPVIISIGSNAIRKRVADKLAYAFGKAIHPSAVLDVTSSVNKGTVIMANATINSSTFVGEHCIVNTKASIDHDCKIGDFVHISPGATLCGGIEIGEGTQVGAGATILPNLTIGKWVTIGAGTVVIEDVPDGAVVIGNPGRIIKRRNVEE